MAPWTFKVKFPYDTQFLFKSLMFTTREGRTLELLTRDPVPSHHKPIYEEATYYPADPSAFSASNGVCSGLNPCVEPYYLSTMTSQGYPIGMPIIQPQAGTLGLTSSVVSTNRDSIEDYHQMRLVAVSPGTCR
jgi:hypothetical protein